MTVVTLITVVTLGSVVSVVTVVTVLCVQEDDFHDPGPAGHTDGQWPADHRAGQTRLSEQRGCPV